MELLQFTCLLLLLSLRFLTGFGQQCGGNQWLCDDGTCLPLSWHCDGYGDCMDGSDEMACPCPRGQVACISGAPGCIITSAVCDGQRQCSDGSDELNCPENQGCLQGDWRCRNKICITKDQYCNGANDCVDNSDETCGRCGPTAVRCPGGVCLTEDERCDGKLHCSDGSDEPSTCGRTCSEENGGCSHSCVDQPWGALCSCPKGHRLSAHGASCLDVDECSLPYGPCMHFCVNTPGSFRCHCRDGFQLQGTTYCYAKGNYTKFLTAKKGTIGFLNLKTLRFESIQSIGYDPLALAFDLSRSSFYWADDQGNICKAKEQRRRILYHGQYGVRSLVCDWLTGQLYWTNQKTRSIHVGAADGSGFATVLAKNIDPLELVLLPIESLLFWINKGPGDKITLERSGMDGLKQESLVVLTAQAPRSLTLDVTVRRLYWMSDFKKSIETVRVDGNGRYSFREFFKRPAQSLAVFERWFYWTDQKGLWRSPQDQPNQKTFIQRTTLPVLEAYHERQQPKAPSACVKSGCQLCMPTLDLPAGFTCTCPDDKLLMADGSCEYPRFAYATSRTLNLFELKGKELIKKLLLTTDDVFESFDIDWRGNWVYWANSTGHVMRWSLNTGQTETVPTLRPACVVSVDQKMRNLYWLSCDEVCVGVTNMDQGYPRRLYQSGSEVRDVYLDWQRGRLYLLEAGWILSMRLPGGNPRKVLRVEGLVAGRIVLDLKSNTLLWNTEGGDLKIMSLLKSQTHLAGREWNVPGSIMAAHAPLLVSLFNDVITVWDRRDRRRAQDVPVRPGVVRVIVALDVKEVPPAQPVCTSPSVMCRGSTLCISQTQLCDTLRDCPDGFDEESCITKCPNRGEFRCKDRRKCIERSLVCDGRSHCQDGSDEVGCQTIAAPTSQTLPLKCRMGSRLCKDGKECVLHSHVCDGEVDCKDGSDEQDCELLCKAGQFQCAHGMKCIDQQQVCDGKAQCQDRSDEMDCFKPTKSCRHRCDNNSRCIPETFLCDGERDCADGSDEEGCDSNKALPPVVPTLVQTCTSPSVMCRGSTLCISQTQLCDTLRDCPDGFDEESCITKCPNRGEFRCKDRRKCIERSLVCDGRSHCQDGSDEVGCPTIAAPTSQTLPLKCRMGSRLCKDGKECVLQSHVCDGEVDCKDGSDEQDCGGSPIPLTTAYLAPTATIPDNLPAQPVCTSPSVMCRGSTLCISQTQLCDTLRDCPDGFDEESCITKCPNRGEFRCKDRRKCIERSLVCDGRSHCQDGSDEVGCQTIAAPTSQTLPLKCRMGSRLCKDGKECVLHSHVCDGEVDCKDGSDEQDCELLCKAGQFQCAHGMKCIDQQQVCDGKAQCQDRSDEMDCFKPTKSCRHRCDNNSRCIPETFLCDGERDCADGSDEEGCDSNKALPPVVPTLVQTCTSPSVMCRGSTLCISQTQLCDTLRDCPDGFDEESCITKCPNRGEFRCKDRRKCIERSLVCDGRSHCQDGSDEVGCPTIAAPTSQTLPLKCRMGSRLCKDGKECVLQSHVCDGEVDCKDGSDEQDCGGSPIPLTTAYLAPTATIPDNLPAQPVCTSPSVMCRGSTLCISQTQLCDTLRDCPDGFDEESCITKCPNRGEFRCKDRRKCIERSLVCDGRSHCQDGSDEVGCQTIAAPTSQTLPLKCRMGSRLCKDGKECVLHSHVCDGEVDCKDGSDEQDCELLCKAGQFQCAHGMKCIDQQQVCDGKAQCQDRSDEMDCFKPTKSCRHRCDNNSRCIPETFLCDGERDCADGSDEEGCDSNKALPPVVPTLVQTCTSPSVMCRGSTLCISQTQLCDTLRDCPDGFDEESCITKCPNRGEFRCKDRRKCIERSLVCDGRSHCQDGSDEVGCPTIAAPTSQTLPLKCRMGSRLCKDGKECVLQSHVCDGEVDCKDGSDEQDCGGSPIPLTTAYLAPTATIPDNLPAQPVCTSPSVMCRGSTLCISQTQLCDTLRDCPDGFDEESCITKCPNRGEFRCKDRRKCIERSLVCDGRSHCQDGSDEVGCQTIAAPTSQTLPLKCRMGSRLCKDGKECVLHSHVCDGEVDCKDGSDEQDCELLCKAGQFQCAHGMKCIDQQQVCDGKAQCQDRSDEMDCFKPTKSCRHRCDNNSRCIPETFLCDGERDCADGSDEEGCDSNKALPPVVPTLVQTCTSPSVMCRGSTLCISQTQLCDTLRDCPDGFDEESCITKCPNRGEFRCKDRRKCIERSLVCDGRSHCQDGSDEVGCPTIAAPTSQTLPLKCRMGSRLCKDGKECVLQSHVCDGEVDCKDGSDEQDCGGSPIPLTTAYLAPTATIPDNLPAQPVCTSPSVMCRGSTLCISQTQLCDTLRDCPDGFDEESCITKCPNRGEFRCKDRRKCIERSLVCDGRSHCQDGSDEVGCQTIAAPTSQTLPLKCRMGSRLCKDGKECVLHSHVCDGEVDCKDGSDEQDCELLCKAGQFQCAHGMKCIDQQQVCDGKAQCQDRSDEMDCFKPTKSCRHRCDNNSRCIPETFLCDGERDCADGSDEEGCDSNKALPPVVPTLVQTCTSPSVMCRGSTLCISQTQLCDTLRDCPDGFDEESCITKCPNGGEFRCKDRRKCIERSLVCDGRSHCQDGSDEVGCQTIAAPTSQTLPLKCRMGSRLCKDGKECVLHSHVCDGEVDCKDGSDEQDCELLCKAGQFQCAHGKKCIDQQQVCDGKAQCQDRSDEMDCFKPTKSCSHRCDNDSRCIPETFLCDGERDCADGSDEEDCVAKPCGQQLYQCSNGQCVSEAFRCDGHADCGDHSDEVGCAKPPHCPPERRCPNSHECLVEEWLCDGEQDCQDGSDERNCKVSPVTCGEFQWSCVSRSQCIPATWRCDGQKDCEDHSDEAGCGQVKCSNQLYQCGSGECVDHSLLCDHIINCPDGSDEGHGCSTTNCSSPGTPQCDQHCVSTPYGPRCICAAGFRLQANGLSCVDVDECNEVLPPVCSHTCLNTHSSFLCRCHHGYLLEPNGRSCKTQDEAHLLASVQFELLVLGLHSSSLSVLSTSQTPVFCVDYDWRDQRVYWVSLEEESIKWTSINTKDTGTLVKGVKSESIAVDWVGRNLYWLDGLASQILAVRLGTSTVKSQNYIVVLDEDLEQPRSLLLLPHKGLMYWSEVGSDPQIERSGMDGSERKVVLTSGLSWPVSLSVDTLTDRIYWADEKLQCIGSVSLEGHDVRLLQLTEMPSPFSVMVFNDMVYWSDTKRRTIQVSHKNTGKNRKVLLKRPGQPFGIRMMHPLQQTNVSSPCEELQCSHICLLAPGLSTSPRAGSMGPKAVCRCATGLLLAGDGLTCSTLVDTTFLLLLSPTAVTQIYLSTIHNGVGLKQLPEHHIWSLPGVHQASGLDLAVQERKVYLADAAQGSVDLLKLSNSGLTPGSRVLNLQGDTVMALAVDWVTLNLYWSSRKQPDLHVTTTRGQHTAPLLQLGLQGTTSIALHPPSGRLCFTALGQVNVRSLPQVDCAFMDGRSQKLLWKKAVMPTSLLFSNKGTQLYWADIGAGVIGSILLDGSGYKQFKADPGLMSFTLVENILLWSSLDKDVTRLWFSDGFQPKQLWFEVNTNVVALRVYSKTSQKGTNSCSERNGGCSQLCLAYPGGRSCRCGRGYQPIDTKMCRPFPSLQCPEGSRACSDGSRCLPLTKFCNHQTDCLDHSDEIKCGSGVKPHDVSHSKPSLGHAGNTVPPGQDWSGRTTPGGVDVQKLDSESCDVQQCHGHGKCVTSGGETTCQCLLGYQGVFCEEGEGPGVSNAPLTLGILSLIGGVLIAAVIIRKSRARAAARGQSTEKETLMTNMDEQTVYAVSFNNDLYDPDQEFISSADGTSQHL